MKDLSESRVLVVDDAEENVAVLVAALRGEYKLSVALGGEQALRQIERSPPDLVLLDIVMPGIDGYEVCRRIRANEAWRETKVMFMSSLEDARDKARGFEAGGDDYVTKPFEPLEVRARVGSLLRAKAYADALKEALARDLRIAREIQMGILPADINALTRGSGLDVAALIEPARMVGGDLYEVLRPSDDRLFVALGDVSGKGIPAALFMAVTMTLMRAMARLHDDPAVILKGVNDELVQQNPRGMFVTLQCAVFDLVRGRVTVASAGHGPAVLLRSGAPPRPAFAATGRVVGMMPDNPVTSESMDLVPGDTLLFFSDGVTEAFDEAAGAARRREAPRPPGRAARRGCRGDGAVRARSRPRPRRPRQAVRRHLHRRVALGPGGRTGAPSGPKGDPMTIARRLLLLAAAPVLILAGLGLLHRVQMGAAETRVRFAGEHQVQSLAALGNISRTFSELRVNLRSVLLARDKGERSRARALFDADKAELEGLLVAYGEALISDPTDRMFLSEFRTLSDQWMVHAEHAISEAEAGREEAARAVLSGDFIALGVRLSKVSAAWIRHNESLAAEAEAAALASIEGSRRTLQVAVGLAIAITGLLGWLTFHRIVHPDPGPRVERPVHRGR